MVGAGRDRSARCSSSDGRRGEVEQQAQIQVVGQSPIRSCGQAASLSAVTAARSRFVYRAKLPQANSRVRGPASASAPAPSPPVAPDPRRSGRGRPPGRLARAARRAAAAASNAGTPCASSPTISPASTSPVPAVASAGGASGLDRRTAVRGRHHRVGTLEQDHRAAARARGPGAAQPVAGEVEQAGELAVVRRQHAVGPQARQQRLPVSAKLVSASASSTVGRPAARTASTMLARGLADAGARADQHGASSARRPAARQRRGVGHRLGHHGGQLRGVGRQRARRGRRC